VDSITHSLFRAVSADNAHQRKVEQEDRGHQTIKQGGFDGSPAIAGLQPFSVRADVHSAFNDADGSDLHIQLTRGDETLNLYLEFVAAGMCPPAGLVENGADVVLSPGEVRVYASTDAGNATWMATLSRLDAHSQQRSDRRAGWTETVR
jgi:hypothetical protein